MRIHNTALSNPWAKKKKTCRYRECYLSNVYNKMLTEFERKVVLRKLIAEALAAQVPRTTVENAVKNYSNVLDRIEALVEIREMRGLPSPQ